ncbi:MAG: hypothetical protein P4M13_02580 [Alphaproteobacteria bacterium]|nr:hypothetical protein [Alphaproteobacteria bacterium]
MNKEIIRTVALPVLMASLAAPPAFAQSLNNGGYMATGALLPFWVNTSSPTPVNIMNLRATPTPNVSINGSVGIGTTTPQVSLDVNGGVRPGSSATVTTCGSGATNGEGTQRYNYGTHIYEFCNGSSWQPFGGSTTMVVGGCQTYWSSCPAGYQATSYFSPGTYNCCDRCGNPAWRYTVCSQ